MPSHRNAKRAVWSYRRPGRKRLQGVANRDIKLENTLLDDSERPLLKICDFGYSKARPAQSHRATSQISIPHFSVSVSWETMVGMRTEGPQNAVP